MELALDDPMLREIDPDLERALRVAAEAVTGTD